MFFMTIQVFKLNFQTYARNKIIKKHFTNKSWNLFHVSFWPKLKITNNAYKKLLNLVFGMTLLLCTCIKLVKKALELQKLRYQIWRRLEKVNNKNQFLHISLKSAFDLKWNKQKWARREDCYICFCVNFGGYFQKFILERKTGQ